MILGIDSQPLPIHRTQGRITRKWKACSQSLECHFHKLSFQASYSVSSRSMILDKTIGAIIFALKNSPHRYVFSNLETSSYRCLSKCEFLERFINLVFRIQALKNKWKVFLKLHYRILLCNFSSLFPKLTIELLWSTLKTKR